MARREDRKFVREGSSEDPIGVGFVVGDDINPNDWGKFKKSTGDKGSETPTGKELDGYFRADSEDIPLQDGDEVYWVRTSTGYELSPTKCSRG